MSISEEIYGLIRFIGENTDETAAARAGALALQGADKPQGAGLSLDIETAWDRPSRYGLRRVV